MATVMKRALDQAVDSDWAEYIHFNMVELPAITAVLGIADRNAAYGLAREAGMSEQRVDAAVQHAQEGFFAHSAPLGLEHAMADVEHDLNLLEQARQSPSSAGAAPNAIRRRVVLNMTDLLREDAWWPCLMRVLAYLDPAGLVALATEKARLAGVET
jgi:hypothetical protein